MNTATMKDWSVTSNQNGFLAPELVELQLQGNIYDDSAGRFPDGAPVKTSTIRAITDHGTHKTVRTDGTEYTVFPAEIDPDYELKYPGAYERLSVNKQGDS